LLIAIFRPRFHGAAAPYAVKHANDPFDARDLILPWYAATLADADPRSIRSSCALTAVSHVASEPARARVSDINFRAPASMLAFSPLPTSIPSRVINHPSSNRMTNSQSNPFLPPERNRACAARLFSMAMPAFLPIEGAKRRSAARVASFLHRNGTARLVQETKKADTTEHGVFNCVGLLVNESPGHRPDYSLFSHPRTLVY
jgi:hypothetical protein